MASLLDPRTSHDLHLRVSRAELAKAERLLKEEYIRFGVQCAKFDREAIGSKKKSVPAVDDPDGDALPALDSDAEVESASDDDDEDWLTRTKVELVDEWEKAWKVWKLKMKFFSLDHDPTGRKWKAKFPEAKLPNEPDVIKDLRTLPLQTLLLEMEQKSWFGLLPRMALQSRACIGALSSASFCERINSQGNLVVDEGNASLQADNVNMVTTLKMNRELNVFLVDFIEKHRAAKTAADEFDKMMQQLLQEQPIHLDLFPAVRADNN